ncbi:MAG: nuclear transport factor 2 family protein, partial [bacterium]|nr:nuclear transport factor 2 family protein [bacterium]
MKLQILYMLMIAALFTVFLSCNTNYDNRDMEELKSEVWNTVKKHNESWTVLEDLNEQEKYIHDDIVFITPGDEFPIEGKQAYLDGYKGWIDSADVHYFRELEHKVRISGNGTAAVVSYYIDMSFNYNGEEKTFRGRDLFFLVLEDGKWLITANEYSPFPDKEGEE